MKKLWPSIEVIETNLFGASADIQAFPGKEVNTGTEADTGTETIPEMPAFLRHKIHQRVSSREANFDTTPAPGQVWRFDGTPEACTPLCVLLDKPAESGQWQGYAVAPETDYATDRDVLLEPQDEPFDPLAGMVQTWNPVTVDIGKASRVLAQLTEARLDAIREVAQGQYENAGNARPGYVAPLKTRSGATVLAGTPATHPEDPRRQYQTLYRKAVQRPGILTHTQPRQHSNVISFLNRQRIWRNVGWSLAASIVLAQAAIIANLMRAQPGTSVEEQINRASEYRATPQPAVDHAYLEVYFKPDAKEVDIRKLLTRLDATIVDGPGEFGQYRVKVKAGVVQGALEALRGSGLVDGVEKKAE